MRIARYLRYIANFGTFYNVDFSKEIEVYVDSDFMGT